MSFALVKGDRQNDKDVNVAPRVYLAARLRAERDDLEGIEVVDDSLNPH